MFLLLALLVVVTVDLEVHTWPVHPKCVLGNQTCINDCFCTQFCYQNFWVLAIIDYNCNKIIMFKNIMFIRLYLFFFEVVIMDI